MDAANANVLELGRTPAHTILRLSWPAILEQIAFTVLNFADTAMVGVLGAVYTAAVGITAPIIWLTGGIIAAVSVGFSVQVAQRVGSGELEDAGRAAAQSLLAAMAAGLLLLGLGLAVTPYLPGWLGAQPEVIPMASQYFFVMCFSFFANSLVVTISSVLRCVGDTKSPMWANMLAIVVNIVFNYLFIYPTHTLTLFGRSVTVWGAGLEVAGAALGSVLAIVVAVLLLLPPLLGNRRGLHITLAAVLRPHRPTLRRAWELGLPVFCERVTLALGQVAFMRIISGLGTTALAAHHLAVQAESLSYMPAFGFSIAATTLVGQSIGAGDPQRARTFGRLAANMSAGLMGITGAVLFFGGGWLVSLFTRDAAVISLGHALLCIVAFAQPPQAYAIAYAGALRGAGDSRWPFYINLVGVWGIRVLLCALFVFGFGWGLRSAWIAMLADLAFRGAVCRKRFLNSVGTA